MAATSSAEGTAGVSPFTLSRQSLRAPSPAPAQAQSAPHSRTCSDPQNGADQQAEAGRPHQQTFGHGAESGEADPSRVLRCLEGLDVVDDGFLLLRGDL